MAQMLVHTAFNLLINPTSAPLRFEAGLQEVPDDLVAHWYVAEHATLVGGAAPVEAEPEVAEPQPEPVTDQAEDQPADEAEPEPEAIPENWEGLHWTQKVVLAKRLAPEAADIDSQTAGDIITAEIARRTNDQA